MSKRNTPGIPPKQKGDKTLGAKKSGHGSYTFKRHPTAKWVKNGWITS